MRVYVAAWGMAALAVLPAGAESQTARGLSRVPPAVAEALRAGDEDHTALRPTEALEHFEAGLATTPDAFELLWRASREALALGELATNDQRRAEWFERGVGYARRAAEAEPERVEGHAHLALALWLSARSRPASDRARRAEGFVGAARQALAVDPSDATAHRVLGAWQADIMRMSAVTRWTLERLVGDAVSGASWAAAEDHLRLAVSAEPQRLVHHYALGTMLIDAGREEEGHEALRQVVERPSLEPMDPALKQRVRDLLAGAGTFD
ncbi:MAG: hypothetical protein RJQ04_08665 [Longimicrobiales bacterium]